MQLIKAILIVLFFPCLCFPATYYVDPTYTDTGSDAVGSASDPWTDISSHWSTINTSLSGEDVTIYISSRIVASDTSEDLGEGIDITNKTADPGNTLTIDGVSYYNTNDSHESGSWSSYSGSNMANVNNIQSQNAGHTKYNNVTVNGLEIHQAAIKNISICGDYWTIQNSEIYHDNGVSDAPLILIVPTADAAHEGSSSYCAASSNITISNNIIHDSYGEMIYVGAGGCSGVDPSGESLCNGYPSHSNITISDNIFYNGGIYGGQGDAVDIKMSVTSTTVSGNEIYNLSTDAVGIKSYGIHDSGGNQDIVIEKNYIHDTSGNIDAAIALSNSWGVSKGVTIRNNIIDTIDGSPASGIVSYDCVSGYQGSGITIYNNTIYNATSYGISIGSYQAVIIKNNLLLSNNGGGNNSHVNYSATGTSLTVTNEGYTGSTYGYGSCVDCVGVTLAEEVNNASGGVFTLINGASSIGGGDTISGFSDDYIGTSRPQGVGWDIGAYEYQGGTGSATGGGSGAVQGGGTGVMSGQ